jgi:Domain of unknown function (DUF1905)
VIRRRDDGVVPLTFTAPLERDADGTWWYLRVPTGIRSALKAHERRGVIAVTATIGDTTWPGSLLPGADGSAQLTVNARIRARESLELGADLLVVLEPRGAGDTAAVPS